MNRLTQLNCIQVFHSFILVFSLTNDKLEGTGITVVLLPTAGQGGGRDTKHSSQEAVTLQSTLKEQIEKMMINYPSQIHITVLALICRSSVVPPPSSTTLPPPIPWCHIM